MRLRLTFFQLLGSFMSIAITAVVLYAIVVGVRSCTGADGKCRESAEIISTQQWASRCPPSATMQAEQTPGGVVVRCTCERQHAP